MAKYADKELPIAEILPRICRLIDPKYKIIRHINKVPEYFDDPKFFHFSAILEPISNDPKKDELSNSVGGYSFFSEDEALLKCVGEAVERHCIRKCSKKSLIKGTYNSFRLKAMNPKTIVSFSKAQRIKSGFEIFNFNESTPFYWEKGINLINNKPIFVPAQLVYLSYELDNDEKYIYLPITTGTAGGSSFVSSVVRGIYEVIERDAFLIFYLNKLPGKKINLHLVKDEKIKFCVESIESYDLKLFCLDITTELGIPTFVSIVIDESGIGPAVSLGLKTNINSQLAILGSMQEALHPRGWIRRKVEDNPNLLKKVKHKHIETLEDRALLWYRRRNIKKLNFFLKQPPKNGELGGGNYGFLEQLEILLKTIKNNHMDAFCVDVTLPVVRTTGYYVVKVLIPQLQPFYLFEDYPYFGGMRLYKLPRVLGFVDHETNEESINKFPHPFL